MARNKLSVGLDIGSSSVKMVHLRESKRGYVLESFGIYPLPPEAIVDGSVMDTQSIVGAVRDLMKMAKVKTKGVATAVSGHSVILKKLSLPQMNQEQLEESMRWEAEQYIPFDINDVNMDVQILNVPEDTSQNMDVILVAAKKDLINDYVTILSDAGLTPEVIDVAPLAVQNCFELNYQVDPTDTVVLLNIGASVATINVVQGGLTLFTREMHMGGNQFTEEIQKQLNISQDEAERMKIGGDIDEVDAVIPQEVERVLQGVSEAMSIEIQKSLDFFASTGADTRIAKVYLSGGTAKVAALYRAIEQRIGVPVEIMNPFKSVEIDSRKFDPNYILHIAPIAAVSVGLALRSGDDR